jgi:hypothetical protein
MAIRRTLFPMRNRVLTSVLVSVLALGSLSASFGDAKGVPNANASGYWTQERRDNAIAREFQFEPGAKVGKLVPQAKRGGTSGGNTITNGTSYWPAKQQDQFVANITGKVFFVMNGTNYVCSGSLIKDDNPDIAIVVTAGHCVWDNSTSGGFATNWIFSPNYDTDSKLNRVNFPAIQLFARKEFTNQTSFNTTAILNDYAFAVISSPDSRVNPSNLPGIGTTGTFVKGNTAYAFGYPQASPFNGNELVYSFGPINTDPYSGNLTWKLASSLTGGASGGPWYSGYSNGNNVGTVGSVNSYKYTTDKNSMYGPQFSQSTIDLFTKAKSLDCSVTSTINCAALP